MAAPMRSNAALLRGIAKEFRHIYDKSAKDKPIYSYIVEQFRRHEVTAKKICRGEKELEHLAETYLCYLYSGRRHHELVKQYKGKGERSVEESAQMVGLSVDGPQDPAR